MRIVIDATNIKAGGGLVHLKRIIEAFNSTSDEIIIIGGKWLGSIEDSSNLTKVIFKKEFSSVFKQEYFKNIKLKEYLKDADIAFIPGGTFSNKNVRYV